MPDYSKSKIYKLTTIHNPDLIYYGSTTVSLKKRKSGHKAQFKSGIRKYMSFDLFELGENDVEITLMEDFNCYSKKELQDRERWYIENNNCINKKVPNRTVKEYYETHKDVIKDYHKQYTLINKDKIKDYKKSYYETNKNEIMNKQKDYYEQNKDIKLEYHKQYYLKNREQKIEYQKQYYLKLKS